MFDEVERLLNLLLVVPAPNATAERSFSALRRLKLYLRANVNQNCDATVLHIHQDRLDKEDLQKPTSDFVSANEYRRSVFGHK